MTDPFVIDGVTHPYNFHPGNLRGRFGRMFADVMYSFYPAVNPPDIAVSRDQWHRDWDPEEFIETMLLESETDMVCTHSLPIFDAFEDGLARAEKGAYLKKAYQDRVLWYARMDMFDVEKSLDELHAQLDAGADGIKMYPARYVDGHTRYWRMDDEKLAFPIFELAEKRGIRNIAIHKALPLGPVSHESMGVGDISDAAECFPDLNFQIVHAGFLFVDETKFLLLNNDNVYATMEASFLACMLNPPEFARLLSEFMAYGGTEKIIYASAAVNPHPQLVLEAFRRFEMPPESPFQLTDEIRAKILGGTLARLHGIDIGAQRRKIANDRFSEARLQNGLRAPWSAVHNESARVR